MNRRAFVVSFTSAPLLPFVDLTGGTRLSRWRRFRSPSDEFASLGVGVRLHGSEDAAERARRADLADPFGRTPGEFYPGPPEEVRFDEALPGHIRRYNATIGAAAEKRTIVVGAFRRGRYSWSVRLIEGPASYAVEAGRAIAAFGLPDPMMAWVEPDLLEGLLPDVDDFSGDVVLVGEGVD